LPASGIHVLSGFVNHLRCMTISTRGSVVV
jgi:hypothetical protein